jgi:hypothetical protein
MKRNVSVVRLVVRIKFRCNILIIKELPGFVGSGTFCIYDISGLRVKLVTHKLGINTKL